MKIRNYKQWLNPKSKQIITTKEINVLISLLPLKYQNMNSKIIIPVNSLHRKLLCLGKGKFYPMDPYGHNEVLYLSDVKNTVILQWNMRDLENNEERDQQRMEHLRISIVTLLYAAIDFEWKKKNNPIKFKKYTDARKQAYFYTISDWYSFATPLFDFAKKYITRDTNCETIRKIVKRGKRSKI